MFNTFNTLTTKYTEELHKYSTKPSKASSKRLRDIINQMQKNAVGAKKALINLDKEM